VNLFAAIVIFCTASPGVADKDQLCLVLEDDRGPYTTQGRCEARVAEMIAQSAPLAMVHFAGSGYLGALQVRGGCRPAPGGAA
jgi:hypothetical protein